MNRSFALSQFLKIVILFNQIIKIFCLNIRFYHKKNQNCEPQSETELAKQQTAIKSLEHLKEKNSPQRKYKRDYNKITDKRVKIQSTLLEYGQQNMMLSSLLISTQPQQPSGNLTQKQQQEQLQKQQQASQAAKEEENHLKQLINEMSETDQKQVIKQE